MMSKQNNPAPEPGKRSGTQIESKDVPGEIGNKGNADNPDSEPGKRSGTRIESKGVPPPADDEPAPQSGGNK